LPPSASPGRPHSGPGCAGSRQTAAAPAARQRTVEAGAQALAQRRHHAGVLERQLGGQQHHQRQRHIQRGRHGLRVQEVGQQDEEAEEDHHEQVAFGVHFQQLEGQQQHQHGHAGVAAQQGAKVR
jgi:hypothetical protein